MPLFSTIIPAYNRATLIAATLDAVLAQADPDQEVLVVDDGSTDGTLDVLAGYGAKIRVLQQQNAGPGAARNLGLAHATGRYVAFLDSDDLWFPWTLQTYRAVLEAHAWPAFLTGQPVVFSDPARLAASTPGPTAVETFPDYYASSDRWRWFSASSFVIRRDVLQQVGGFTAQWVNAEDADLALRLGTAPGFVHLTAPVTFAYREHPTSAVAHVGRTYAGLRHIVEQEWAGAYPGGPARARERRRIICGFVRPATLALLNGGHCDEAWWLYRQTWAWQLGLGRLRYLAAFPVLSAVRRPPAPAGKDGPRP